MAHDPMCPMPDSRFMSATCYCALIARVRADEALQYLVTDREQQQREQAAYDKGRADEQADWADSYNAAYERGQRDAAAPRTLTADDDDVYLGDCCYALHSSTKPCPRDTKPRILTADCMHLAEMYVGQSGRDNEYGRKSSVIECLACGALRLDDETVPPKPRTLTADEATRSERDSIGRARPETDRRAPNRRWGCVMTPTEKAVALLKSIGLDITYTDEGLRVVAEQIGRAYRADERERIRTWCMEGKHYEGCACDVVDTLNRIDRGGD